MTDPYAPGTRSDSPDTGQPQTSPAPAPHVADPYTTERLDAPSGYDAGYRRPEPAAPTAPVPANDSGYQRTESGSSPAAPTAPTDSGYQRAEPASPTPPPTPPYQPTTPLWPTGQAAQPGYPGAATGWQQPTAVAPQSRRSRLVVWAVVVAAVLLLASIMQTVLLVNTRSALDDQRRSAAAAQARNDKRLKALEGTVNGLERQAENSMDSEAVAKKALPSIFQVTAGQFGGSSFAIGRAPSGGTYLLTNNHVVRALLASGRRTVQLERGSATFSATVIEHSASHDVAVLKTNQRFDILPLNRHVQPGEPVVVIGSPLGLNDSVTTGVVSAAARDVPGDNEQFIQFDAAINPGNSGGPVMNAKGQVVGIATEKARDAEGIGLAIPISVPCDKFSVCGS